MEETCKAMGSLSIWMSVKEVFKTSIHTPTFSVYKKRKLYPLNISIFLNLHFIHLTHLFGKLDDKKPQMLQTACKNMIIKISKQ